MPSERKGKRNKMGAAVSRVLIAMFPINITSSGPIIYKYREKR